MWSLTLSFIVKCGPQQRAATRSGFILSSLRQKAQPSTFIYQLREEKRGRRKHHDHNTVIRAHGGSEGRREGEREARDRDIKWGEWDSRERKRESSSKTLSLLIFSEVWSSLEEKSQLILCNSVGCWQEERQTRCWQQLHMCRCTVCACVLQRKTWLGSVALSGAVSTLVNKTSLKYQVTGIDWIYCRLLKKSNSWSSSDGSEGR